MLRWTEGGAVTAPTVLQIRVQRRYGGRVRAGAPVPSRSLSAEEVRDNILHFTAGMRGPRSRPCTGLVLSGQGVGRRPDLVDVVRLARREGVERVVLHLDPTDLDPFDRQAWRDRADLLVLPLRPGTDLPAVTAAAARLAAAGLPLSTHTVVDRSTLRSLDRILDAIRHLRPRHHTFTFPFPTHPAAVDAAPDPLAAAAAIDRVLATVGNGPDPPPSLGVKGLPACYLGTSRPLLRRTGNRWYVDADHQAEQALLFFPDVVAFYKAEACRFCALSDACDGFFSVYLRRPGARPLQPIDEDAVTVR